MQQLQEEWILRVVAAREREEKATEGAKASRPLDSRSLMELVNVFAPPIAIYLSHAHFFFCLDFVGGDSYKTFKIDKMRFFVDLCDKTVHNQVRTLKHIYQVSR